MTIYDFLKLEKSDYDTYDTEYDVCVTCCEPYEDDEQDNYDAFCECIYKHVELVEKTGECSCVANWTKFITDNMDVFRECANEMWYEGSVPKSDDSLTYKWINEIHSWLAGYVSETEYKHFMEKYAPRLKEV